MNASLGKFHGTWDEFYGLFQKNSLAYGDWFDYTNGYWKLRSKSNVFIVKYEEMIEDLQGFVEKLARFLSKELMLYWENRPIHATDSLQLCT